ncbi:MAG TPA: dihydrodipicolinate reductase C-terminal domain-containing protein [Xanthomonadales bacterium]|nr:dihydrodipicolinate reductase C-terminal domain-containing protein [Xanthomonadales bacterium]
MTRVVLYGAGRTAATIAAAAAQETSVEISAIVSRSQPAWDTRINYVPTLDQLGQVPQVLIDFSLPEGTATAAAWCRNSGVALLSGVTGLPPATHELLALAAQKVGVLWSPNMSIGVNLLAQLCRQAAAVAGPAATVHIEDTHHQWKKDAPSGTALMLGGAIQSHWPTGRIDIGYQSRREGEVIGTHSVTFSLPGEQIVLSHEALDRGIFARGALAAAQWLAGQPAGLYTAADWLAHRPQ